MSTKGNAIKAVLHSSALIDELKTQGHSEKEVEKAEQAFDALAEILVHALQTEVAQQLLSSTDDE